MASKRKREAIKPPEDEEWVSHKSKLRELFFSSNLTKLMKHMEREYNFIASWVYSSEVIIS
jgi:hypothetical protein